MSTTITKEATLSRRQAAARHDVHPATVDRWSMNGINGLRLPRHRRGGRIVYLPHEIDAWFDALDRLNGNKSASEPSVEARAERADSLCAGLGC